MFSESSFYPHNFGFNGNFGDGGRWRIKNLQEKRSLFVSVFVFLEKNLSKTKIDHGFGLNLQVFWRKKFKSPGFALSEVGRSGIAIEYYPGFAVRLLRLRLIVFNYVQLRSIDSIVFDCPTPRSLAWAGANTSIGIGIS